MLDRALHLLIDIDLLLFGALILAVLSITNEAGFRLGRWQVRHHPERAHNAESIGAITTAMLGLLAFTLGLTISIAQDRFEARRALVVQGANTIGSTWLRAQLAADPEGPAIMALVETFAKVELAYIVADSPTAEPPLIAAINSVQTQIWRQVKTLARRDPSPVTELLIVSVNEMFDAALAERFAFDSQVPPTMSWLLMAGSVLAIGAMGYHLGSAGTRHLVLTAMLLAMWSGGMMLIADLNHARAGVIKVDPAPLVWTIQGFAQTP